MSTAHASIRFQPVAAAFFSLALFPMRRIDGDRSNQKKKRRSLGAGSFKRAFVASLFFLFLLPMRCKIWQVFPGSIPFFPRGSKAGTTVLPCRGQSIRGRRATESSSTGQSSVYITASAFGLQGSETGGTSPSSRWACLFGCRMCRACRRLVRLGRRGMRSCYHGYSTVSHILYRVLEE